MFCLNQFSILKVLADSSVSVTDWGLSWVGLLPARNYGTARDVGQTGGTELVLQFERDTLLNTKFIVCMTEKGLQTIYLSCLLL